MDSTVIKIDSPQVKFETINNLKKLKPIYNTKYDTFFLRSDKPQPATSYDLNGMMWLRVDVVTGEVIGLQIDNFESVFIKKYPELAKAWKEAKPVCVRAKSKKCTDDMRESFLLIIINFVLTFFRDNPNQGSFSLLPA